MQLTLEIRGKTFTAEGTHFEALATEIAQQAGIIPETEGIVSCDEEQRKKLGL